MLEHSKDPQGEKKCGIREPINATRSNYRVAFIGAGRVGSALGLFISHRGKRAGLTVAGYSSRTYASSQKAAQLTKSRVFSTPLEAWNNADIVLITTPDAYIKPVWHSLCEQIDQQRGELGENSSKCEKNASALLAEQKIVGHCSGALSADVFQKAPFRISIHPLYAVQSAETWKELDRAWWCCDGDQASIQILSTCFSSMGIRTQTISSAAKVRYHAAAVLASNCITALFSRAAEQLVLCGFGQAEAYEALTPLFWGNAEHIVHSGIIASLTGPAQRGDTNTIDAHRACLSGDDRIIYDVLTRELQRLAGQRAS